MGRKIKIHVKGCIPGHELGDVVTVAADVEGTPLDLHWRRRLQDAELDDCCEVVVEQEIPDPQDIESQDE